MSNEESQRLIETGIEKCRKGQYEEALIYYNDAEKIGLNESILYNRSKAYFKLHKLNEAIRDIDNLIEMQPDNSVWFAERAVIYHSKKDKVNALLNLDKAVDLDPKNGFRYASRAFIKDFYGDHQGAISDYEKAIELDPDDAISYNNKGLVEEKLGYKEKAKTSFILADQLDNRKTSRSISTRSQSTLIKKPLDPDSQKETQSVMTAGHFIKTLREVATSKKGAKSFLNFMFGKIDNR